MDINPYKFTAPFEAFEFANHHLQQDTNIITLSNAWLKSGTNVIEYWATRLSPLFEQDILVFISNRTGQEGDTIFCGNSCALKFSSGHLTLLGKLGEKPGLLVVDTSM
jgi:protein N-terminal amidase